MAVLIVPKLLVIADDLSGATDVGVQFAKQGVPAIVTFEQSDLARLLAKHEVVLVDIESRHLSPAEAARRVRSIVTAARHSGVERFYKKTDSTLRGNVGAELEALLKESGAKTLCFVPAHPVLGRTTRDGVHFVNGIPLHESAFSVDPRDPVTESRVPTLLARQTKAPITLVRQNELDQFTARPPAGIVVFDAETQGDIEAIAAAIHRAGCLRALAGPAALASCLPPLVSFLRSRKEPVALPHRLLVINGSLNAVARRQCSVARQHGFADVTVPPVALLGEDHASEQARHENAKQIISLLAARCDVVVSSSTASRAGPGQFKAAAETICPEAQLWPERIALNLGRIVSKVLRDARHAKSLNAPDFALVVIGGDTLAGVAHANSWQAFLPRNEILPGVAVCEVSEQSGLVLVTKPGGFGPDDVLLQLRAAALR